MTEAQKKRRARADLGINRMIITTLMSSVDGRRWVWLKLEAGHVFAQTVDLTPAGHAIMAFREGERAAALALLVDVMALAPQQFVNMLTENGTAKDQADDRHDSSPSEPEPEPGAGDYREPSSDGDA